MYNTCTLGNDIVNISIERSKFKHLDQKFMHRVFTINEQLMKEHFMNRECTHINQLCVFCWEAHSTCNATITFITLHHMPVIALTTMHTTRAHHQSQILPDWGQNWTLKQTPTFLTYHTQHPTTFLACIHTHACANQHVHHEMRQQQQATSELCH